MQAKSEPLTTETAEEDHNKLSRRDLLKLIPPALLAGFVSSHNIADVQAASNKPGINLKGKDFEGWIVDLGDALYSRPGEAPVDISDIETAHQGKYSELRANIKRRVIMAHNVTFRRVIDENVMRGCTNVPINSDCRTCRGRL